MNQNLKNQRFLESLRKDKNRSTHNFRYREGTNSNGEFVMLLEEYRTATNGNPFYVMCFFPETNRIIEQVAEIKTVPSGVPFHSKSINAGQLVVIRDEILQGDLFDFSRAVE